MSDLKGEEDLSNMTISNFGEQEMDLVWTLPFKRVTKIRDLGIFRRILESLRVFLVPR